jgi:hypothetical protein
MIRRKAALRFSCGHDSPATTGPAAYSAIQPLNPISLSQILQTPTDEKEDDIEKIN